MTAFVVIFVPRLDSGGERGLWQIIIIIVPNSALLILVVPINCGEIVNNPKYEIELK